MGVLSRLPNAVLARFFFERSKQSRLWQRRERYQKIVRMIEWHRDGIAAYCHPDNQASIGHVERLNYEIRVIQRSA